MKTCSHNQIYKIGILFISLMIFSCLINAHFAFATITVSQEPITKTNTIGSTSPTAPTDSTNSDVPKDKVITQDVTNATAIMGNGNINLTVNLKGQGGKQKRTTTTAVTTTITPRNEGKIATLSICGDGICDRDNGEYGACNGSCDPDKGCCSQDCGTEVCGDGICSPAESCSTCEKDCGRCKYFCGDKSCDTKENGETCVTCSTDCGSCCGNKQCSSVEHETCSSCPADCGACPNTCPNGLCESGETCTSCSQDCGACLVCGNGGTCPTACPNGHCESGETCSSCPQDCGACVTVTPLCGDGACNGGETCTSCFRDCGLCACLLAGTPIAMADGTTKTIETLKKGDKVLAFDEKSKKFKTAKVTKVLNHTSDGYLMINGHLKITGNHPVYSNGKWVQIGRLKEGDMLFDDKKQRVPIISKKYVPGKVKTYNLVVNPYHTYIADGYVVHNKAITRDP